MAMKRGETVTVALERRQELGKGGARKLRRVGYVPAVLYSRDSASGSEPLKIRLGELERILRIPGVTHHILELSIDGEKRRGIIKDIQYNPVKNEIWHIDFYEVKADQKISLTVPVVIQGESKGVKAGGILEIVTPELEIECLPDAIPEAIVVDVTELEVGDAIHVRELKVPEGVTVAENPDEVVVVVTPPEVAVEEEEEKTEEEPEAPKVIAKGKTEKEK
ncbi:50S ribosomal protein L25/general stress protein Ctc [Candidatus Caldatribacterium saccharofermentans]|uniref:50S ribosomal protein L25/general stress protein Ctc n=1 Tax=Candidatus Caldatribacterium saccharofermentans TaxID=1454753 RepID=UPI003D0169D9